MDLEQEVALCKPLCELAGQLNAWEKSFQKSFETNAEAIAQAESEARQYLFRHFAPLADAQKRVRDACEALHIAVVRSLAMYGVESKMMPLPYLMPLDALSQEMERTSVLYDEAHNREDVKVASSRTAEFLVAQIPGNLEKCQSMARVKAHADALSATMARVLTMYGFYEYSGV